MKYNSKKIAISGMLAALSIIFMLFGNLIPIATYVVPVITSLLIIPILYEYKTKTAFTFYISVSLLSIFFVADKELCLMYVLCFGLFSVFKTFIETKYNKLQKFVIKLLYANFSLILIYSLLILVFPISSIVNEFYDSAPILIIGFILFFDLTFLLYDKMLSIYTAIYIKKYRKKLFK